MYDFFCLAKHALVIKAGIPLTTLDWINTGFWPRISNYQVIVIKTYTNEGLAVEVRSIQMRTGYS